MGGWWDNTGKALGPPEAEPRSTPEPVPPPRRREAPPRRPPAGERDPREDEEWFRRLPPEVQEETRAAWRDRENSLTPSLEASWNRDKRAARDAALLLTGTLFLSNLLTASPGHLAWVVFLGLLVGAGAGIAIERMGAGRFGAALVGVGAYLLVHAGATGLLASGSILDVAGPMQFFLGAWLIAMLFAAFGMRREFRQVDGSDGPYHRR